MSLIDEFVVADENRELFERVMKVTQATEPVRMMVYGPAGSGKTSLVQARGRERDLLSDKEVMFCHGEELVSFFNIGEVGEQFLMRAGSADVLLIDGFETFFGGEEVASQLCKLLVKERNRLHLSTLVFSGVPFDELDLSVMEGAFDGYDRWEMVPLDDEGRVKCAHAAYEAARRGARNGQVAAHLTDETLEYLAKERGGDLGEMKMAIKFLTTAAGFEEDQEVTPELAHEALTA